MSDEDSQNATGGEDGSGEGSTDSPPGYAVSGTDAIDAIETHLAEHPFLSRAGIIPQSFEGGVLRATLEYDEQFTNPVPEAPLNGGFLLTVLDTIMGFTIQAATFDDETVTSGPTMNLNGNFLSAATGDIIAEGEIVRLGGSSVVVDGRIRDMETRDLVATAQGTWRLYRTD